MLVFITEWLRISSHCFLFISEIQRNSCLAQVLSNFQFVERESFCRNVLNIFNRLPSSQTLNPSHSPLCVSQVLLLNVCTAMKRSAIERNVSYWLTVLGRKVEHRWNLCQSCYKKQKVLSREQFVSTHVKGAWMKANSSSVLKLAVCTD